eukprot:7838238-Ditylum_brightwellii.AAC.1
MGTSKIFRRIMQILRSHLTRMNFWTFLNSESQQVGVESLPYKALIQWIKAYASLWISVPIWSLVNRARRNPGSKRPVKLKEGN